MYPAIKPVAVDFHLRVPGDFDVLADFGDHRLAFGFEIGIGLGRVTFRNLVAKRAEGVIARHKVRLAVHLHEHAQFAVRRNVLGNGALLRVARRFYGGGCLALFAQNFHGNLEAAFRFDERLFAIHHAGPGHFAEFANVSSSNFSHINGLRVEC